VAAVKLQITVHVQRICFVL